MTREKPLSGRLTISRCNTGVVRLELIDDRSFSRVVEIEISKEEFAEALFAHAQRPCSFELSDLSLVGKRREHKQELVYVPDVVRITKESDATKLLKSFEVDGWRGRLSDLTNHHNWTREPLPKGKKEGRMVRVTFVRYVDDDKPKTS